jgi:pilus assembly protein CpaE
MNCSAHIDAECPDVKTALAILRRGGSEKRLLILQLNSEPDIEGLARVTSSLPGWPVLALVAADGPLNRSDKGIIGIMRAGAAQIVSLPLQAHDFKAALDRLAVQFVYTSKSSKVIAVAGASGGSGATSIAINLAHEIAFRYDLRCVLADLSLRMGAVAAHLNIEPSHTIVDLLRDIGRVDTVLAQKVLHRVGENLHVLAGPHRFLTPTVVNIDDLTHIIETLQQIADIVVLDVPCTYDDVYFEVLTGASTAILVGEQTLPSIRALKMVREQIGRGSGTASELVVINKFDPKNRGFAVDRLLNPLGVTSVVTISRDDTAMRSAIDSGCALRLAAPKSPALADIGALTDALMIAPASARAKPQGLFSRLGRAITNT